MSLDKFFIDIFNPSYYKLNEKGSFMSLINKLLKSFFVLSLLVSSMSIPLYLQANEIKKTIVMVGSRSTKESFHGKWLTLIYTEAFKRLGYRLEYKAYPAKRASMLSDLGKVDGEINRVYSYSNKHPNMLRVGESHYSAYFVAYGMGDDLKLDAWKSLKEGNYKVGYRNGVKKTETNLIKHVPNDRLIITSTNNQGLKQVLVGRTKVFVDVRHNIVDVIKADKKLKNSALKEIGIMEKVDVHSFLHKKNAKLVPLLTQTLQQMKKEGLILKFKKEAEKLSL